MTETTGPLLKLDTLVQRNFILIDQKPFDLVNAEELSLFDRHRLIRACTRMQEIEALPERTPDIEAEYTGLLDFVVRIILLAPPELHQRLERAHREAISLTFSALLLMPLGTARATPNERLGRSTGAKSARGSRASTVAHRKTG